MFEDCTILITGGTGSFGKTVLKYFLDAPVKEIRIFSRDEKKQDDMRTSLATNKVKFYIGDVRDYSSVFQAMTGVDFVFHAAALKQVPSCEFYPMEAVRTNVMGTENVLNAALERQVRKLVVLSTDKAVYPINAMGLSKAMAEKLVIAKSRIFPENSPVICTTRYGNVMASRGSVIPLFVRQLKSGTPLTITDPNMTRFLMSLDDSVDLVLHALEFGKPGDLFVQQAPACTVADLAQALTEIFNKKDDLEIIGTRHGEKLYESLVSREEMARAEQHERYFRIPIDARDLNYNKYFVEGETKVSSAEDYTSHNTTRLGVKEVKELLLSLDYIKQELND
jgi:UDP-glucose 4-epimerase